jgi:sulfoxide reductase heme-binding subunit YedZ
VHGGFLLLDGYLPFSLRSLLVPGTAPYRPVAVAVGVVAAELLAALAIANHYRRQLSYGFWRRTHYLNFVVWALALGHGLAAGTDSTTPWALALFLASAGAIVGLTVRRALRAAPLFWAGTAALVSAELVVALALGPLHHHGGG